MNQIEQIEQIEMIEGNTKQSFKKQDIQGKNWCFTLNNPTEIEIEQIEYEKQSFLKWVFGNEIGENGTPHIQGYICFKYKKRLTEVKKIIVRAHWEKRKGTEEQAVQYCMKDSKYTLSTNLDEYVIEEIKTLDIDKLYPWQKDIHALLATEPDDRTINWIYEGVGNVGKSAFSKFLALKLNACIIQKGRYADIMNHVFLYNKLKIFIIDVPRNSGNNVSYDAIESIKGGIIFNSKYETGQKMINSPHIIVFSNFPPNVNKMSLDRWNIKCINSDKELCDIGFDEGHIGELNLGEIPLH